MGELVGFRIVTHSKASTSLGKGEWPEAMSVNDWTASRTPPSVHSLTSRRQSNEDLISLSSVILSVLNERILPNSDRTAPSTVLATTSGSRSLWIALRTENNADPGAAPLMVEASAGTSHESVLHARS